MTTPTTSARRLDRPEASPSTAATDFERVDCAVCGSDIVSPARVRIRRDDLAHVLDLPTGRSRWVVCDRCGLVFQSPRPGPEAVTRLYDGGEYHVARGGIPEHYVQYSLRRSVEALDWALDRVGGPGRALDVGCGIGGALVKLRDEGWDVVGVEPDAEMAEVARTRFDLDARDGFFTGGSFPPGEAFDLAYSCHVWEHLADPLATTRAAARLLAPTGGHLMIVVPTFRRPRTLAWDCFSAPHTYMFTEVSLGNVVAQAGLEMVDHQFHAGADSELWLLARARPDGQPADVPVVREDLAAIQRELTVVPLKAPLGLPGRMADHLRTFGADPGDFVSRAGRGVRRRLDRFR